MSKRISIALVTLNPEENKILDKMHRQKVAEVEKLTQTVRELEKVLLAGAGAANAVCDYQRKVQEMNEERKTLEQEVACAKVTANRVATVVANEWKDANDKVIPVKQWLEERKFFQEKYQMRFKVLEERLKTSNGNSCIASEGRTTSNGSSRRQSLGFSREFLKIILQWVSIIENFKFTLWASQIKQC
ncbi:microtubule-associated protein 70-2-like isoform X2 [Quercus lobata]|uniref:microtubule-associated protein 70-2-like isoform X2 n=1 Tax=Quercus lobata TaxID=97700 RepID=UPI0012459A1A|nr:microtubule-associated protein 70-2-like isoform X2 [Quercus lobata]